MLTANLEQGMASEALVNLLNWCKRERESLQMQREMLQSGRVRILENDGSGQRDLSDESIKLARVQ